MARPPLPGWRVTSRPSSTAATESTAKQSAAGCQDETEGRIEQPGGDGREAEPDQEDAGREELEPRSARGRG